MAITDATAGIQLFRLSLDSKTIAASPFALVGPPSAIAEMLIERRERFGFSYITVGADVFGAFAPVVARLAGT